MNTKLLLKIADVLEKRPELHDQQHWSSERELRHIDDAALATCGTTACIAGWAVHLGSAPDAEVGNDDTHEEARKLLGITDADAELLFSSHWKPRNGISVSAELRLISESGVVKQTATAGDRGTATAGYQGTATAGDEGTATAGDQGTATAGYQGTATAGYQGVLIWLFWDAKQSKTRRVVAAVCQTLDADGVTIAANTPYKLNDDGVPVRVTQGGAA